MLDFEWVAPYLNINRDSIRRLGNTATRIFAFLFQNAWDRKPGHTVLLALHDRVTGQSEKGATRGSAITVKISLQPLHEFAPTIGRKVVLCIHQTLTFPLVVIQSSRYGLLREVDDGGLVGFGHMCGLHRATQEDCNDNHNERIAHGLFPFLCHLPVVSNWNPSRHRGSSGDLGWFCTKSCNSGLNGWPSPEKRASRNVGIPQIPDDDKRTSRDLAVTISHDTLPFITSVYIGALSFSTCNQFSSCISLQFVHHPS